MSKKPDINLEGLTPEEAEIVMDKYASWAQAQLDDFMNAPIYEDLTSDQMEALSWLAKPPKKFEEPTALNSHES